MKKFLALLLTGVLCCSFMFTGCGSKDVSNQNINKKVETNDKEVIKEESNITPPGTYPIVKEPVTLSVFTYGNLENDLNKNYFVEWYTELTNVNIDWVVTTMDQFKEKLNLMLVSGDAPDIIQAGGNSLTELSRTEELKYASQDVIIPLNDLIEKQSTNLKQLLDYKDFPGLREAITTPEGNIYGFPTIGSAYHTFYAQKMNVYIPWLERLGLEIPETPEEFKEMLIAFRDQDANGNGDPNDEIPLASCKAGAFVQLDGFLMDPFEYTSAYDHRMALTENGKVYASYIQNGYREGLKYLADLYSEGLIYPEAFTMDRDTLAKLNAINSEDDVIRVGVVPAMHKGYYLSGDPDAQEEVWRDWLAIPPLKNKDGDRVAGNYYPLYAYKNATVLITSNCENPEVAFRWIDGMYDGCFDSEYEVNKIASMGIKDVQWRDPKPGEVGIDGKPATRANYDLEPMSEDDPYFNNTNMPTSCGPISNGGWAVPEGMTYKDDHSGAYEQYLWWVTDTNYAPYERPYELCLPPLYMNESDSQEIAQLETTIKTYVEEMIARFVIGDKDINDDDDWEKYLSELESVGLSRYLELLQNAYDTQMK